MIHLFYLISSNIEEYKKPNLIIEDIFNNTKKTNPKILVFANSLSDIENSYILKVFSKYTNNLFVFDNDKQSLKEKILNSDIVYFHGGNPYKYRIFYDYKDYIKNIPIKIGNSAGAIFLSNHTFYVQKDDYIIAIDKMLDFVNLHIFPHSEIYKEEIVFNYLIYENPTNILRLYGNSCLKIEYSLDNKTQKVFSIIDDFSFNGKIELFIKNISYTYNQSQEIDLLEKLINY